MREKGMRSGGEGNGGVAAEEEAAPPPPRRSDEQQREEEAEGQSPSLRRRAPAARNVGYLGKHRLSAAIARLDQEVQSLEEELNELETMEAASAACQEVITSTEGKPDPLLPITSGPENSSWDRWFQRVRSSRSHKWWAHRGSDFS